MTYLQSEVWNETRALILQDPTNNEEFYSKLEVVLKMLSTVKRMHDEAHKLVK